MFESVIEASPERVFAFHERSDAITLLTPWWSGARVVHPAASLQAGERTLLVLGRWPLQIEWEAVHESYARPSGFVESQLRGPFRRWRHRHLVLPDGGGARLRDELQYELPGGPFLAPVLNLVLRPFLWRLFKYRHSVTRQRVLADTPRVSVADQLTVAGTARRRDSERPIRRAPGRRLSRGLSDGCPRIAHRRRWKG
ncbi:MAG: SRPBCC family protein [Chloroflexota bacterium]